ncbi:MAG: DUF2794 domain-containing protein [Pseudomonadota bacterium]
MSFDRPIDISLVTGTAPAGHQPRSTPSIVSFNRAELSLILGVYGRMLTVNMARDYAIDHLSDRAVFSIFRRASETPLYRVEKRPKDANRQGAWSVVASTGGILKRGRDLRQVLKVFDRKLIRAVD